LAGEIFMLEANAIGARRAWVFDFFVSHLPLTARLGPAEAPLRIAR
jgi:hypothetical protein